jgi:hypothetical protein
MTFTWVFVRGAERLEIRRDAEPAVRQLEIWSSTGDTQTIDFDSHAALVAYQADFESSLTRDRWAFLEFQPERRAGGDRRAVARPPDRRRRPHASVGR